VPSTTCSPGLKRDRCRPTAPPDGSLPAPGPLPRPHCVPRPTQPKNSTTSPPPQDDRIDESGELDSDATVIPFGVFNAREEAERFW